MFCKNCGAQNDDGVVFCKSCGAKIAGQPEQSAQVKKGNGKLIAMIAAAAVLVIAAVACILIFTGGKDGPFDALRDGVEKLIDAKGFDFEVTTEDSYGSRTVEGALAYDLKKRELTAEIKDDDSTMYIYKDYGIETYDGELDDAYDISEVLDSFYASYDEMMKASDDASLSEMLEALDDENGGELSEYIRINKVDDCIDELEKLLNNEKWLEDHLDDYKREKSGGRTEYSMEVSSTAILEGIYEAIEPALKISGDDFEEMLDEIDSSDFEFVLNFAVEKGYLVWAEFSGDMEGDRIVVEVSFSNINDPSLDMEKIEVIYKEATGEIETPPTPETDEPSYAGQGGAARAE